MMQRIVTFAISIWHLHSATAKNLDLKRLLQSLPGQTIHRTRKTQFPFRFLGVFLVLAGLAVIFSGKASSSYLWSLMGYGSFALAAICFGLAKRQRAPSVEQVFAKDKRQPVLLLRSFSGETPLTAMEWSELSRKAANLPWAEKKTWE